MKKHPHLKKVEAKLSSQYHFEFLDSNILTVSVDKGFSPFAHLVVDESQYPGIIMSLSVDFPESFIVADLTLSLMHVCPITLGEVFYRSNGGDLYWDLDAHFQYDIESNSDLLEDLEPISNSIN